MAIPVCASMSASSVCLVGEIASQTHTIPQPISRTELPCLVHPEKIINHLETPMNSFERGPAQDINDLIETCWVLLGCAAEVLAREAKKPRKRILKIARAMELINSVRICARSEHDELCTVYSQDSANVEVTAGEVRDVLIPAIFLFEAGLAEEAKKALTLASEGSEIEIIRRASRLLLRCKSGSPVASS